jgi:hypothetical protein
MANVKNSLKQKRMKEIEDRKIEIILEIAQINDHNNEIVSRLNTEYAKLHEEYFLLQLELYSKKSKERIDENGFYA